MFQSHLAYHLYNLLASGAAELGEESFDLRLDGDDLHTAKPSNLCDLFLLEQQLYKLMLGGCEPRHIVNKENEAPLASAQAVKFLSVYEDRLPADSASLIRKYIRLLDRRGPVPAISALKSGFRFLSAAYTVKFFGM